MRSNIQRRAILFLTGIFISSLGSTAFVIALITFPALSGVSALTIGAIIGTSRIVSVLTTFFAGPIGDHINPRKIVYFGEFGALVCSIFIWKFSFSFSDENYIFFLLFIAARSFCTAIQAGSTQKIGKIFDDSLSLHGKFAKYLNKATFGAIFFAMGLNLIVLRFGSFQDLILVDAATFLINGVLVLFSIRQIGKDDKIKDSQPIPNLAKVWAENRNYIKFHPSLARLDMLLAILMMGANTLNVALLVKDPSLTPFASGIFGLAVWLAAPVEKYLRPQRTTLWLMLALAIFAQGFFVESPVIVLFFAVFRNLAYWIIFNDLSAEIMKNSKQAGFAGVSSGRNVAINLVGAIGEFWVGLKVLPIFFEVGWRSCFGIVGRIWQSRHAKTAVVVAAISLGCDSGYSITLPIRTSVINTDPQTMEDVTSLFVNRQIHRGLVRYTSELELVNDLAESYTVGESGKLYVFKLGKNYFSDSSAITADDVVRTFKRMKKVKSAIVADLHSIIGFGERDGSVDVGVKSRGVDTVVFTLHFADPFFIKNLAAVDCSILKFDKNLERSKVTSGRYTFEEEGSKISLKLRDSKLFPFAPAEISLLKVSSDQQAIDLARAGAIDSLESFEIPLEEQQKFISNGWHKLETQLARLIFLSLNPKKIPIETRHQIYSILQGVEEKGLLEGYHPAYGIIPPLLAGSLNQNDIRHNLGFKPPKQKPISIELSYPEGREFKGLAKWAAEILSKSGFKVNLKPFPLGEYFKVVRSNEYQIMMRSKYLDYPDGMSVLTYFKSSLPINTFHAGDSFSDKLIAEAQMESLVARRVEHYKNIQIHLLKNFTIVPLVSGTVQSFLCSDKIKSIKAHPLGLHSVYLHEIELSRGGN